MKKLIGFLLILAIGAVLGYVFHDTIDTKLKAKFGNEKVEAGKAKVEKGGEKTLKVTKAMANAGKEALNSSTTE